MATDPPQTVKQMASYAAYHLNPQAGRGGAWSEQQVEGKLRGLYPNATDEDIATALHYGRESAAAAEAYAAGAYEKTLGEAADLPVGQSATVYFRIQWGEGKGAMYRIYGVTATERSTLEQLAEEAIDAAEGDADEGSGIRADPSQVQLFKIDFFPQVQ